MVKHHIIVYIYVLLLVLQVTHMHGKFLRKSVMHVTLEQIIHCQKHILINITS
jgi:hypothetical protein